MSGVISKVYDCSVGLGKFNELNGRIPVGVWWWSGPEVGSWWRKVVGEKLVAVASDGVEIGVVEEVCHDGKEFEKRGCVEVGGTNGVERWDFRTLGKDGVDV